MTTAFETMTDALFSDDNIAQAVTYKVGGIGAGVTVRGIVAQPQKVVGLGSAGALVPERTLDVRVSEIAAPADGDTVVIGAITYRVVAPELDSGGLVWHLALDNT